MFTLPVSKIYSALATHRNGWEEGSGGDDCPYPAGKGGNDDWLNKNFVFWERRDIINLLRSLDNSNV